MSKILCIISTILLISAMLYIGNSEDIKRDWIIDTLTKKVDENINLEGNLTIKENGTLILERSNLVIENKEDFQYKITVEKNGKLILREYSTIYSFYNFTFRIEGSFEVDNSSIIVPYGIEFNSVSINITNSQIIGEKFSALRIKNSSITIKNSVIVGNISAIEIVNSSHKIINNTISTDKRGVGIYASNSSGIIEENEISYNYYGIYFNKTNLKMEKNDINNNTHGILFYSSSIEMYNTTLINNEKDFYFKNNSNSHLFSINTEFNRTFFEENSNSSIKVSWYLNVFVIGWIAQPTTLFPIIIIKDKNGREVYNKTSEVGEAKGILLTQYYRDDKNNISYTPHLIIVKRGYIEENKIVEINSNKEVIIDIAPKSGNIKGRATLEDETVFSGIEITLYLNDTIIANTSTNDNGDYSFNFIPFGDYVIKAEKDGYYPQEKQIEVISSDVPIFVEEFNLLKIKENNTIEKEENNITFIPLIIVLMVLITIIVYYFAKKKEKFIKELRKSK